MKGKRYSRQRELIYEALTADHRASHRRDDLSVAETGKSEPEPGDRLPKSESDGR